MNQAPAPQTTKARTGAPGRPKDAAKGAAILDAAKRLFVELGFEGASMDQIAAEAGVSKLTVYSHFGDKETLFAEACRAYCEQQLPTSMFADCAGLPLRDCLVQIGRAFVAMVTAPEAISGHRILCTPQLVDSSVAALFWESGPARVQQAFARLLEQRIAAGELEVDDLALAASQFFVLLKGDMHAHRIFGCEQAGCDPDAHVAGAVDMFLRAYAVRGR